MGRIAKNSISQRMTVLCFVLYFFKSNELTTMSEKSLALQHYTSHRCLTGYTMMQCKCKTFFCLLFNTVTKTQWERLIFYCSDSELLRQFLVPTLNLWWLHKFIAPTMCETFVLYLRTYSFFMFRIICQACKQLQIMIGLLCCVVFVI